MISPVMGTERFEIIVGDPFGGIVIGTFVLAKVWQLIDLKSKTVDQAVGPQRLFDLILQ